MNSHERSAATLGWADVAVSSRDISRFGTTIFRTRYVDASSSSSPSVGESPLLKIQREGGCPLLNGSSLLTLVLLLVYPYSRQIEVVSDRQTGETILDEALKAMKAQQEGPGAGVPGEKMSVGSWIDLFSGECNQKRLGE